MKRIFLLVSALVIVAAACTGTTVQETVETLPGNADSSTMDPDPGATEQSTEAPASDGSTNDDSTDDAAATDESKPPPEGPDAPDFTLALESGGEFVLSQQVKPVYMVFWAEW